MKGLFSVPVVFALTLAAPGCDITVNKNGVSLDIAEGKATDEWTRSYTIAPGGLLEIVNVNGSISASPATGAQVEVLARREVKTQSQEASRELLQKVQMVEEVAPNRVKVHARADWEQTFGNLGRRSQVNIEYRLSVPAGLKVSLVTQNGAVRLENVQGSIVASSTNGGVFGRGLSGSLNASTVNGGVQIDLASVTGDVQLVTVNGAIRLELPLDVDATLDARAVNGTVTVDDQLPIETTERARLHVAGRINDGGPKISVQTTNGGVRVMARGGRRGRGPFAEAP